MTGSRTTHTDKNSAVGNTQVKKITTPESKATIHVAGDKKEEVAD